MTEKIEVMFHTEVTHKDTYDMELYKYTIYVEENTVLFKFGSGIGGIDAWGIDSVVEFIESKISNMKISMILN